MKKNWVGSLLLLITAFIWGTAFVAQRMGMDHIQPLTFNGVRNVLGGVALLPVALYLSRGTKITRATWIGGLCCGVVLFIASTLQQFGIAGTTVGKAGFITAMYIVLVPLLGLLLHKKVPLRVWGAVALAAIGLYLLCMKEGLALTAGDTLVLLCAVMFSVHILVIDHFSSKADCVMMSCIQFFVAGALGLIGMALYEKPSVSAIWDARWSIVYAGVLSSGVAYTLQIIAQKRTPPAVASLLMSLEAVFSALAGWLILSENFTSREMLGVLLMFAAILLAQIPVNRRKQAKE